MLAAERCHGAGPFAHRYRSGQLASGSQRKSRRDAYSAFQRFLAHVPDDSEIDNALYHALDNPNQVSASARSIALIGAAYIDGHLEKCIRRHFPADSPTAPGDKLFDPNSNGPLVSISAKAKLACALGIIDQTTLEDIELIGTIRNGFAHHPIEFGFDSKEITELCGQFHILQQSYLREIVRSGSARRKFSAAIVIYYDDLSIYLKKAGKRAP